MGAACWRSAGVLAARWGRRLQPPLLRFAGPFARRRPFVGGSACRHGAEHHRRAQGRGHDDVLGQLGQVGDGQGRAHRSEACANAAAEVFALDALARLARASGDPDRAVELSCRAEDRFPLAQHFITQRDRVDTLPTDV